MSPDAPDIVAAPSELEGVVLAMFAFDIGFQIELETAERRLEEATRRQVVRARRPAPVWFDYSPPPLRLVVDGPTVTVDAATTEAGTEILVYDFGAALATFRLPMPAGLDKMIDLSVSLDEHPDLAAEARRRVTAVMEAMGDAVERPRLAEATEAYTVFVVTGGPPEPHAFAGAHRRTIAQLIEADRSELSSQQVERSVGGSMSYASTDLAIVDWNAALLFDPEPDDVIAVLQHANVELLQLRVLDAELDAILDHADETLAALTRSRVWPGFSSGRLLRRFASAQTDAAVRFEGVNNAIKLLGNQYLARLYRLAAARLDLPAWQDGVTRKLEATNSLYDKMCEATSTRRLETLEWVIIVLIAVSIMLPFTPWYH